MTIEVANGLYRYFETLYYLNRQLIILCGVDVLDNIGQYEKYIEEVIQAIPRLVPYQYDKKTANHKLVYTDGLLEFSSEIDFLKNDYEEIFDSNKTLLVQIKKLRNKLEHKMHGATIKASSAGSVSLFEIVYKIDDDYIDFSILDIIELIKSINLVFAKLQHAVDMFAGKNNLADRPYYWKLVRYNFSDFNNIYECDLLRTFGKAMLPF